MTTWDRFKNDNQTGFETELYSGKVWQPRAYCDDTSATGIYTNKAPVCKLKVTPRTQYTGSAHAWDISQSISATSTLDVYSIDWGGATDIGDISNAAWSGAKTGNVIYDNPGTYTIEAWVKDLLSVQSIHVFLTVEVVNPIERVYIGTIDLGVFISDNGSTPTASNTGLTGDDLKLRAIRLNPYTADLDADEQHVWLCTKTGLAYSTDGAANWTVISQATLGEPANTAADAPAPATADLDQIDLCFDSQDDRKIYLLRTWASPRRAWVYVSSDYGATWANYQVMKP